jgi:hypothetical protein
MARWKKIGGWILALLLIFLLFMVWYKDTYSMKVAKPFEVNSPSNKDHILIATQGSEFKDSLVQEVVNSLKPKSVYIKVIDVSELTTIREADWAAIIILHTWENWKPQKDAKLFIEQIHDKQKLIVVATSGQGSYHLSDIDGITSASNLTEVSSIANEITGRVTKLLTEENK